MDVRIKHPSINDIIGLTGIGGAALAGVDTSNALSILGSLYLIGPVAKFAVAFPLTYHYLGQHGVSLIANIALLNIIILLIVIIIYYCFSNISVSYFPPQYLKHLSDCISSYPIPSLSCPVHLTCLDQGVCAICCGTDCLRHCSPTRAWKRPAWCSWVWQGH